MQPSKFFWLLTSLVIIPPTLILAETAEEKGLRIAREVDKANSGFKSETADMEMILKNATGDTTRRKLRISVLERKGGDRSISIFLWPADVKGTKLLTWSHKKKSDDQWLYLPSFKRVKRISGRSKRGSFMGSEFAFEDLGAQEIEKYTYKFIRDDKTPEGKILWVQQRVPIDKYSGYSKQVSWTDPSMMNVTRVEYYDRRGELLKYADFGGYKKYGKFYRVGSIHMKNAQTKKESILSWENRRLGKGVSAEEFEPTSLDE